MTDDSVPSQLVALSTDAEKLVKCLNVHAALDESISALQKSGRKSRPKLSIGSRSMRRMSYALAHAAQFKFPKFTLDNDGVATDVTKANHIIVRRFMFDRLKDFSDMREKDALEIIELAMICIKYPSHTRKAVAAMELTMNHARACQEVPSGNTWHYVLKALGFEVDHTSSRWMQNLCHQVPNYRARAGPMVAA